MNQDKLTETEVLNQITCLTAKHSRSICAVERQFAIQVKPGGLR